MARKDNDQIDTGHVVLDSDDRTREPPVVYVDYERYAHLLAESDASDEEKHAFLQLLWEIVCEFVALGYGVHAVQQARETCGKPAENRNEPPHSGGEEVESEGQTPRNKFNDAAVREEAPAAEEIQE